MIEFSLLMVNFFFTGCSQSDRGSLQNQISESITRKNKAQALKFRARQSNRASGRWPRFGASPSTSLQRSWIPGAPLRLSWFLPKGPAPPPPPFILNIASARVTCADIFYSLRGKIFLFYVSFCSRTLFLFGENWCIWWEEIRGLVFLDAGSGLARIWCARKKNIFQFYMNFDTFWIKITGEIWMWYSVSIYIGNISIHTKISETSKGCNPFHFYLLFRNIKGIHKKYFFMYLLIVDFTMNLIRI